MDADAPVYVDSTGLLAALQRESTGGSAAAMADWTPEEQAMVEGFLAAGRRQLQQTPSEPGVLFSPEERQGAVLQSIVAELVRSGELPARQLDTGVVEAAYDNRDVVGWAPTVFGLVRQWLTLGRFDWRSPPAQPEPIADDARIGIIGDWGSGTYGAPVCAASIAADPQGFDAVVHLGDIYYSGTEGEVEANFLRAWPSTTQRSGAPARFRACNGNHEMYSGGKPYAEVILERFGQPSSAFAMENDAWLLVGLDTAYDEWELGNDQLPWLRDLLARDDGRRVVLFSHHQPYSHFSSPKGGLRSAVDQLVAEFPGKLHTWYWGHEHLGAIYDVYAPWGLHGRCIGHSGFPYFRESRVRESPHRPAADASAGAELVDLAAHDGAPAAVIVDGPNHLIGDGGGTADTYGPNGYLTVELSGAQLHERLLTAEGALLWERTT